MATFSQQTNQPHSSDAKKFGCDEFEPASDRSLGDSIMLAPSQIRSPSRLMGRSRPQEDSNPNSNLNSRRTSLLLLDPSQSDFRIAPNSSSRILSDTGRQFGTIKPKLSIK